MTDVTDVGTGFVGQICKGLYIENECSIRRMKSFSTGTAQNMKQP